MCSGENPVRKKAVTTECIYLSTHRYDQRVNREDKSYGGQDKICMPFPSEHVPYVFDCIGIMCVRVRVCGSVVTGQ